MVTSDFNYNAISINHMRYNEQITNNDKIENKMNLKYLLHVGKIGASNISIEYVRKHKRILFGTYIQQRHNKSMRSNALHSKKHCRVTDAIVELVDIFPTIADLAGVPIPICQVINNNTNDHLKNILIQNKVPNPCSEGITLLPLIKSTLQCQVRHIFYCIMNYTNVLYKTKVLHLYNLSPLICKYFRAYLGKRRHSVNIQDQKFNLCYILIATSPV